MEDKLPEYDDTDPFADDIEEDLRDVERRMNIHRLKNEVKEITGVEPVTYENPDAPAEVVEGFWNSINEWERAPDTTQTEMWERDNAPLPQPEDLTDEEIHAELWKVIEWMASRRIYITDTEHLSDRELYTYLLAEGMNEWTKEFSPKSQMNFHMSPIGSGSQEDNQVYMRFYADEDYRKHWAKQYPNDFIPEAKKPQYDRDRLLPQAIYLPVDVPWDEEDEQDIEGFGDDEFEDDDEDDVIGK